MDTTIGISTEKWLILFRGEAISYQHKPTGAQTTFDDSWTHEEFTAEQDWLNRLTELGITPEE